MNNLDILIEIKIFLQYLIKHLKIYRIFFSSTSNIKVAFPGIAGGDPLGPYLKVDTKMYSIKRGKCNS